MFLRLLPYLLVIAGAITAVLAYNHAISKAERLEADNKILQAQSEAYYKAKEQQKKLNEEINSKYQTARTNADNLRKKLQEHNLGNIIKKKPGLAARAINNGTERVRKQLEAAANH